MTPLKKIYLLSSVLIFLVTGCATSAGKGSIFPMVGADPINRYPIDDNQIKKFGSSIRAVQGGPQAKYDLARHFQRMQKHRIAIEALKEIIQMEPDHADAHNALGYSYDSLGEYEKAQTHYRVAMRLDPEMHYAFNNMGYSLILDGNYTAAVEVLKQAVALKRDDPKYHRNLGLAYLKSGDLQMAVNEFKGQAKAIDNEKAETLPANKEERSTSGELLEEGLFETGILASRTERIKPAPVETGQDPILIGNVEVSNGNGVRGMARAVGDYLRTRGIGSYRLTNAGHFGHDRTLIYYREGFYDQAARIKQLLPGLSGSDHLVATHLPREPLRVLIGRDLAAFNLRPQTDIKVDVSNGNGVSGMARRLGRHLAREGFRVGRLTNADHFGYRQTIVFHSKGTEDRARLIADALPRNIQVPIVELNDRAGHIQVRIGSDMVF